MMNAVTRALMLYWIEFKRCQGIFVAPLVAVELIWMYQGRFDREGVVLWRDVSMKVTESSWIAGSVGAAFTVWVVDRSRRRRMREQESTMPVPQGRTTLLSMLAVLVWMLFAYFAVFAWFAVPAVRFATWGGPDISLMLIGALSIAVGVGIGAITGWFGRSATLAPLTLFFVWAGNVYAADSMYNRESGILVPIRFLDELNFGLRFNLPQAMIWSMIAWLAALSLLLGLVALLLRERTLLRGLGCVLAVFLVVGSANQVLAERVGWPGEQRSTLEEADAYELDCRQSDAIEVCVHPAFSALLDEFAVAADQVYGPLAGLPGLPERLIGGQTYRSNLAGSGSVYAYFGDGRTIEFGVGESLGNVFTQGNGDPGVLSASQCVVLAALSKSGQYQSCMWGNIAEDPMVGPGANERHASEWIEPMEAKVESFSALTPDAQRAWLQGNWDDLRAGDISLDEMP